MICEFKNIPLNYLNLNSLENIFIESSLIIFKENDNSIEFSSDMILKINKFILNNISLKNNIINNDLWKLKYHDMYENFKTIICSITNIIFKCQCRPQKSSCI